MPPLLVRPLRMPLADEAHVNGAHAFGRSRRIAKVPRASPLVVMLRSVSALTARCAQSPTGCGRRSSHRCVFCSPSQPSDPRMRTQQRPRRVAGPAFGREGAHREAIDMGHSNAIQMDRPTCGAPAHPVPGTPRLWGAIITVRDTSARYRVPAATRSGNPSALGHTRTLVRHAVSPTVPPKT